MCRREFAIGTDEAVAWGGGKTKDKRYKTQEDPLLGGEGGGLLRQKTKDTRHKKERH